MPRFSPRLLRRSCRLAFWLIDLSAIAFLLLLMRAMLLAGGIQTPLVTLWTGCLVGAMGLHVLLKIASYSLPAPEDAPRLDWIE